MPASSLGENGDDADELRWQVSRLWRQLSMDSQLWPSVPAATLLGSNSLHRDGIDTLLRFTGAFATALDARGLGSWLDWKALGTLVDVAAVHGRGSTRLVSIDLTGEKQSRRNSAASN